MKNATMVSRNLRIARAEPEAAIAEAIALFLKKRVGGHH